MSTTPSSSGFVPLVVLHPTGTSSTDITTASPATEATVTRPTTAPSAVADADATLHQSRDSIADIWGERAPYYGEWPIRVDERVSEMPDRWVQSACLLCSNGCGIDIGVKDGRMVGVRGRAADRVNRGRLGPKGLHCYTVNQHHDRLTHPLIRKGGQFMQASWDEAMDLIVRKTKEVQDEMSVHGIGFYTSGQLFLEEYYTLALIGKGGLSSLHMDGNTRLCTATAAAAMRETFGCDGQPGSYTDIDTTDCILLVGHNISATQTVLWSRMLDRLKGPRPPKLIVIDPRRTATAKEATVHLAPRIGTNLAVLNGIQHLLLKNNQIDHDFLKKHTVGLDDIKTTVASYTPDFVAQISGVPAALLRQAADILGTTKTLLSTALQGVYQSNQATASACQINNINLLRGLIGKPGCGIYQMNGQPTAQNNRETGCNGEFPGFRNYQNMDHMKDLAKHWNVDVSKVPHWSVPTHIMEMLHFIETGTIKMLWVSGTNPAVSLPELERVRTLFTKPELFLVVQDIFMTETAQLADVVLPAAMWGEKTGCFTNVDRTVHLSHKAIEPPGEAKADLEIFIEYARRMGFKDKDDQPLVKWSTPEEAFEAWKQCTAGTACDYTGLSYAKLTGGSGIQWPCNPQTSPDGTERLYTEWHFPTDLDHCESYGHDLETGTPLTKEKYLTINPAGRAILKAAHYRQAEETPNQEYPFALSTGRVVYHFHTRTKTGRSKQLQGAAPEPFVQISQHDATALGIATGDLVLVTSARSSVQVPAKVGDIEAGQVFIPFHYGYWDAEDGRSRAANELTVTAWDPVSKQPCFKGGAVRVQRVDDVEIHSKEKQSAAIVRAEHGTATQHADQQPGHRHVEDCLGLLVASNSALQRVYQQLIAQHDKQAEIRSGLKELAVLAGAVERQLGPFLEKYGERKESGEADSSRLASALFPSSRVSGGAYGLLRDMQCLYTFISGVMATITSLQPTASALQDTHLVHALQFASTQTERQQAWALSKAKMKAPQTLLVPS